jgi:hypothetical protein
VTLLVVAFLRNSRPFVMFVMFVLGFGTIFPGALLFRVVYNTFLRRPGFLVARFTEGDLASYLFAQGLQASVLAVALFFLIASKSPTGWIITGVVAVSAAAHLLFNMSIGRLLYYRLARWGFIDRPFQHQRQER